VKLEGIRALQKNRQIVWMKGIPKAAKNKEGSFSTGTLLKLNFRNPKQ
jgi:hypothetical protein